MRHKKIGRVIAVSATVLLIASGCSSERSEPEGGNEPGGGESSAVAAMPTDTFGDMESPCGEGDASGATDPGVTDDAIAIGYGDDKGYTASPGLNQDLGDAMEAMISWCNSVGGINGREIEGHRYDAALVNSAQVIKEACAQDFMMVGQGFAGDENMEAERIGCQLVTVPGFQLSSNAVMGPMKYAAVPFPVDEYNIAPMNLVPETFPEFKENFDFLGHDSPFVQQAQAKTEAAFASLGLDAADCGVVIKSAGGDNYRALVQKFQSCGVEAIWETSPPQPAGYAFLDAMRVEGYEPTIVTDSTWYTEQVLTSNANGLTEGINISMQFQPFENADIVPAVADYLAVMSQNEDYEVGLLGMQAASSFLMWAQAAKTCGADLTRQCMVDELSKVTEWTGAGMHAQTNPADNRVSNCSLIMEVKGDEFVQLAPAERGEFVCVDEPQKTDPSTWGVELNKDRIATAYLSDDILVPSS